MLALPATRDLRDLPKAHLHLHLSGALRRGLLAVPYPPLDGTFATFVQVMAAHGSAIRTEQDLARLICQMAKEAAEQGVVWLEASMGLRRGLVEQFGLPSREALLQLVLGSARQAEAETAVGIGLLLTANRTRSREDALDLAQLAARYAGRGVVGFGLADDEVRGPADRFAEAFGIARAAGLISAPHGGELAGAESVRAALDHLGAQRVQHGVRAIEDPALVARLADEQICLDVCPTSNVQLGVVPSIGEHPLPALIAAGVPASLNADCPAVFGCGALDEYELARRELGMDDATLASIAEASIRASGAPDHIRADALRGISAWRQTHPRSEIDG